MIRTLSTITIALAALALAVGCNEAPTVDAGDDFEAVVGQTVEFTPTGMDADDDLLEYEWRFVSIPDGSDAVLMDTDRPYAFFVADVVGEYVAEVVNFDDGDRSEPDTITVTVREAPAAEIADLPAAVLPGETVTLDTRSGVPGEVTVLVVISLFGQPTFLPIFGLGVLDADGERSLGFGPTPPFLASGTA